MAEEKFIKLEQLESTIDWKYLGLLSLGMELSDNIVGLIRNFLPFAGASPLLKILAGWGLSTFLAPRLAPEYTTPFFHGVIVAGISEFIRQVGGGALGALFASPAQTQQTQTPAETGVIIV